MQLIESVVETMDLYFALYKAVRDENDNVVDFDILYINESACRLTGTTKQLSKGKRMLELYGSHKYFNMFVKIVETGGSLIQCVHFDSDDNNAYNMICSKYEDGVVIVCQKMSPSESDTFERKELFRVEANESDNLVFTINKNLEFSFFNVKWLDYRKTDLDSELSRDINEFIHSDDIEGFYNKMKSIRLKNEPSLLEFRLLDENGLYRWFNGVVIPKFNDMGYFVEGIAYCYDFTEGMLYNGNIQRFQSILSDIDIGIIMKNKYGIITDWNKGAQNILGYSPEEVIGNTSDVYLIEEQRYEVKSIFEDIKQTLKARHIWIKSKHKDGRTIISYASFTPLLDINNEFSGYFVMFRDMTEDRLSEERVHNMEAIFNVADAGLILKDPNGVVIDWNAGAEKILGYKREEVLGKATKYYAPNESHDLIDKIDDTLISGEHIAHVEVIRRHKDGRLIDCSVSYTPVMDNHGNVLGSVSIFHDITDKKIAEQKAKNLAAIFSGADAGIILKNKDGIVTDWNVGAQNILGFTEEEAVGKDSTIYTPPEYIDYGEELEKIIMNGEHISHMEITRRHKDGRMINLSASFTPLRNISGDITGSVSIFHDITEKKQIEKKHKELENTLSNLFDNLTSGFCLYELVESSEGDEDIRIVMANRAFAFLLDEPYESLPGRLFSEICFGDIVFLPTYISIAKNGTVMSFENYSVFFKKHVNVVLYSPVRGQVAIIVSDRSHLVEAEQALKERENSLALLFTSMTSGFCLGRVVRNFRGDVIDIIYEMVNKAFKEMEAVTSPLPHKTELGNTMTDDNMFLNVFVEVATNKVRKNIKKYIPSTNTTLEIICFSPKEDYFVCVENDISEQVKAEEELEKAYRDTAAIISEIPAPICVVSRENGIILDSNAAFKKMCQLNSTNNITGNPVGNYFKRNSELYDINIIDSLCLGVNFVCNMRKLDGSEIEVQVFSRPMVYNEQDAFAVHCIDLTQQRLQEQALRDAANTAEEASKMKSSFLANMSHEIRTPLNGVLGFTELALESKDIDNTIRDYITKIKLSAQGLLEIINDVLDISKIEYGKIEIEKVPFSLHDVFRQCETISSTKAAEKGITLYFYSEPYIGKKLIGDPTKIRQIILNLLSNAIKFTNVGIVKVMSLSEEIEGGKFKIYFEVKDSGIGMTEEQLKKVFDPFIQGDSSTTRKYGGSGLGLSITRSLIELMGGEIYVESLPGIGSRFSFTLIFDSIDVSANELENKTTEIIKISKPLFSGDALVCEDNDVNQQVIKEHLLRIGLNPTVVPNGKAGVESVKNMMIQGKSYDIILMDIHMPIMDGLEATEKILKLGVNTPIIAMTANVMSKDREEYLSRGMSDYLSKPFESNDLWVCLLKYINPIDVMTTISEEGIKSEDEDSNKVINTSLGIKRSAGDELLYESLLRKFVKSNKNTFTEFTNALNNGDKKYAHRIIHTIKGVAAMLGAINLQNAALDIEISLAADNGEVIEGQIISFEYELNAVLAELSKYDNEPVNKNIQNTILDKPAAIDLIKRLDPLIKSGDSYSIELLEQEDEILRPIGKLYEELAAQIDDYEFETAYKILASIKQSLEE